MLAALAAQAAAQKITGKEDYKFGGLSKAAVGKVGDLVSDPAMSPAIVGPGKADSACP